MNSGSPDSLRVFVSTHCLHANRCPLRSKMLHLRRFAPTRLQAFFYLKAVDTKLHKLKLVCNEMGTFWPQFPAEMPVLACQASNPTVAYHSPRDVHGGVPAKPRS
ncbi:hypothetical protein CHELA40_13415 [Chelatococcus asaccharovorans]|nr:hypothetical protein CHELA40_13415 [Chelatococcus asaccharovorans]CAH1678174.1 hypothetical protein CHELA17_62204 [Chelatococcus asaccharovorans]